MAALVQLFSFLFILWPGAAAFPAGPRWEWVSSMAEWTGGKEFGEVAQPLVMMNRNTQQYPQVTPIEGWVLSDKVEPLWQAEAESANALALVYEEVEAQGPRAVIAFRGHMEGNMIDSCATALLAVDKNTTLLSWCYATYNALTFDYYSQAVPYTMLVLESYPSPSVLLSGTSLGGFLVDLVVAGVLTNYSTALSVIAFESGGHLRAMHALGISLQGHYTSVVGLGHEWDPYIKLHWDDRVGTVCLFSGEKPSICNACFEATPNSLVPSHHLQVQPTSLQEMSQDCHNCASLTHDSFLLLDMMLEGVNHTCYLIEDTLALTH